MSAYRTVIFLLVFCAIGLGISQAQTNPPIQPPQKPAPPSGQPAPAKAAAPATSQPAQDDIPPAAPGALFPALAARVNGKAILGRNLERLIKAELVTIGSPAWMSLRGDYRQDLTSKHLGSLVATELLYQKAIVGGMKATDAEVQAELGKIAKTYASDAEMNVALARQGMDRAGLLKELERNLVVGKFIQENVTKKAVVVPAELSEYYSSHAEEFRHPDMVRTSHILIVVKEGASEEQDRQAEQRAAEILARVKKGEDFVKLAKENSSDPSASQGGDIGFIGSGDTAPEYEAAAFALEVGGISDVVRTDFGYHIIKVTDKKKAGLSTLEEARTELTTFLKNQKAQAELGKLVDGLRAQARIEVFLPPGSLPSSDSAVPTAPPGH